MPPVSCPSLNLLVTEKFWKKESRKKCLIYITLSIVLCGKIKIWNKLSVATTDVAMETSISCSWGEIKDDLSVKIWSQLSIVNSFLLKDFSIRYPTEKWSEQNKSATRKYCTVSKFSKLTPQKKNIAVSGENLWWFRACAFQGLFSLWRLTLSNQSQETRKF